MVDDASAEDLLGWMYTELGLANRWTSVPSHQGSAPIDRLLSVPASDGQSLYPAFQFVNPESPWPRGQLPGLDGVARTLTSAGASPLTVCVWLMTEDERLGGMSAIERLRGLGDVGRVLAMARLDVARWGT